MIWKETENLISIRFEEGEDFLENLKKILKKASIKGGIIISCVGQFREVEIAYYSKEEKKYYTKEFKEVFEVLQMSGNISFEKDEIIVHAHVTLGNKNFSCVGGHLNKAIVNSTLELFILKSPFKFEKLIDGKTGLKILNFADQ